MEIYVVGGAVRDDLLGLPIKDRDFVVVGATPEHLIAQGYKPVGKDFPVFLHPDSHEEYALARTERKTGHGYHGFVCHASPEVSLEQDLARRDLTINAMARDAQGRLVDPFDGYGDLRRRRLRHVGPAFSEDPVRILRIARFAARFTDFAIADETMDLMCAMVAHGEADHLVPERVWQEIAKGLMEKRPSRMIAALRDCGALARLLPELDALFGVPQPAQHHPEIDTGEHIKLVVDLAASMEASLPVRYAGLLHDLGKGLTPPSLWPKHHGHDAAGVSLAERLSCRLRAPSECRDLAVLASRFHIVLHQGPQLRPKTVIKVLTHTDGFRRPERFKQLLQVAECDARGRLGLADSAYHQRQYWLEALALAKAVDTAGIARNTADKARIPEMIHAARVNAVKPLCLQPGS